MSFNKTNTSISDYTDQLETFLRSPRYAQLRELSRETDTRVPFSDAVRITGLAEAVTLEFCFDGFVGCAGGRTGAVELFDIARAICDGFTKKYQIVDVESLIVFLHDELKEASVGSLVGN